MFIKKGERIAVTADGVVDEKDITPETDVIYVKPKMDFGTRSRFIDSYVDMEMGGKKNKVMAGESNIALLELNIVAWDGPSFKGFTLCRENIEALDQDEPIVDRVIEELNRRNFQQDKTRPKSAATS